jgi:hypothetical protein
MSTVTIMLRMFMLLMTMHDRNEHLTLVLPPICRGDIRQRWGDVLDLAHLGNALNGAKVIDFDEFDRESGSRNVDTALHLRVRTPLQFPSPPRRFEQYNCEEIDVHQAANTFACARLTFAKTKCFDAFVGMTF